MNRRVLKSIILSIICLFYFGGIAAAQTTNIYKQLEYPLYDPNSGDTNQDCTTDSSGTDVSGNDIKQGFEYFVSKGLSDVQAAGLMGNLIYESGGFRPNADEQKKTADQPTPNDGFGIAQWTTQSRQQGLIDLAQQEGKPVTDLGVQLDYVWQELNGGYRQVLGQLKPATAITTSNDVGADQGSVVIVQGNTQKGGPYPGYESPKDEAASLPDRVADAKATLAKYGGSATSDPISSDPVSSDCSACLSPGVAGASGQTVVVLDPGHAGANTKQVDPTTGLETLESGGAPGEMQSMWDTAQLIKTKLEAAGYTVVLTKNSEADTAGFVYKAARANAANASIAVSLHYTEGQFGAANDNYGVTPQVVGEYRQNNDNGKRDTFTDQVLAQKSQQYAQTIASARDKTGDNTKVVNLDNSFPPNRPDILAYGNIPIIELLGKVPWVYNEVGYNGFDEQKYAEGVANGIMAAVPAAGGGGNTCSGAVSGSAVATAVNYAWPQYRGDPYCDQKPSYTTAINKASAAGQYTGAACDTDSSLIGDDCGGFTTRVMIDSGADAGFNYGGALSNGAGNTVTQQKYLDEQVAAGKYQNLGAQTDTTNLQPGDIAINSEHTFIYVGKQTGFNGNTASASLGTRAPMASNAYFDNSAGPFSWYRLVK